MKTAEPPVMHPAHTQIWELLPWYLNDSLEPDEGEEVRQHLSECLVCKREMRRLETLAAAVAVPNAEHACAQAFARLSQQIRSAGAPSRWTQRLFTTLRDVFEPVPLLAGAAVLVVSSLVVALIVVSGEGDIYPGDQPFQTLGTQQSRAFEISHPLVRVVLRERPEDGGLQAWLERHAAELVDGPSDIGVLTVRVAMGSRTFDTVLTGIRADQETLFIEPVNLIGNRPDRHR